MKYGIIAALDCEVDILRKRLENANEETITGNTFYEGKIGDNDVVLMMCGIGKVSAALGCQTMIIKYQPDVIINTGCAGAIAEDLKVGDIVLSTQSAEWDMDITALGDPRGYIQNLDRVRMDADKALLEKIDAVIGEGETVKKGLVVSADQFVSSQAQRDIILGSFPDALCAEMEGASIGHVATQANVPFVIVRCMSDTADGSSEISYFEFKQIAGEKSANIIISLLEK